MFYFLFTYLLFNSTKLPFHPQPSRSTSLPFFLEHLVESEIQYRVFSLSGWSVKFGGSLPF